MPNLGYIEKSWHIGGDLSILYYGDVWGWNGADPDAIAASWSLLSMQLRGQTQNE